jgi:UDP-3-O-acyl-N-acetylglucosamine deacetylase
VLTHEQLAVILNKEELKIGDVMLLHYHLDAIGDLQEQYGENMPMDVDMTLASDCELIIERLKRHLTSKGIFNLP